MNKILQLVDFSSIKNHSNAFTNIQGLWENHHQKKRTIH